MDKFGRPDPVKLHQAMIKAKFGGELSNPDKCYPQATLSIDNMFDIAKIFNREANAQIQIPLEHLCANELNLAFKKKPYPYLFTEAKVAMALY